jgi:hypothetical protein
MFLLYLQIIVETSLSLFLSLYLSLANIDSNAVETHRNTHNF